MEWETVLEVLVAVLGLLSAWLAKRTSSVAKQRDAAIEGVETYAASPAPQMNSDIKKVVQSAALKRGVEQALHVAVERMFPSEK